MKIHEYNQMMAYLTRPAMNIGGRVGYKPGGIVEPGVTHYAKEDFIRNPAGINQHTAKMKSLDEIKATIDKFPEWTKTDFLGDGTFNKQGIVLSRTELERAEEAGIEPHVKGKRTLKGTGARNLKRRIITKARSSESMEVALAALKKSGLNFSHLALDELTSLQNTGYLPKDINIKGYHKFEKKVVDIAKQIKETQNNKKFSIPERRNKIAKLQKEDRALRKQFPEYAKTKARLVTKATSLDPSGIMIKEKLLDPKIAISQEPGTQLKGLTPKSEKGQEIIKMSKKSLAKVIEIAKTAKGPAKVKAVASMIAILGSGKLADEVLKKQGISLTQDENEKVLEASILPTELIQEHPVTSTLGAAATLRASKSVKGDPLKKVRRLHKLVSTPLKKLIRTAGTPLAGAGFAGWQIHDNLKSGESVADAVVDPLVGAELAFPSLFKENLSKIIPDKYKGKLAKAGRNVLGLGKVIPRFMGPVGIGIGATGSVYDAYKDYERRKEFITPETITKAQQEQFDANQPMFNEGGRVGLNNYLDDLLGEGND